MSSDNPILVTGGAVVEALRSSRTRRLKSNPRAVCQMFGDSFRCNAE